VWVTGLPRNDEIFHPGNELLKICDRTEYKKVVLWMPTYRNARFRHTGLDGDENEFGLRVFVDKYMNKVNRELADKNILLLIKPHPMDRMSENGFSQLSNVIFFTNDDVDSKDIEMYRLLAETDALISDYSSVIVDYLLTDKPIGIVAGDIEQYGSNRGFVLNPVEDYLPGPILRDIDEFENFLLNIDAISDSWCEKRKYLKELFHKYRDDKSAGRVCDRIFGETKGVR
jgi:CDP-glycerol glycerophosphotransferase (TagB/SpsB family)